MIWRRREGRRRRGSNKESKLHGVSTAPVSPLLFRRLAQARATCAKTITRFATVPRSGLQPQFLRCCFAVWFRLAQTCAKSIRRFATLARLWLGLPSSCGIHTQPSEMAKIALRQQLPTCETRRPLRVDYTHRKEHTCVLANRIKTGFASHFGIFCVTRACVVVIYAVLGSVFKLPTA